MWGVGRKSRNVRGRERRFRGSDGAERNRPPQAAIDLAWTSETARRGVAASGVRERAAPWRAAVYAAAETIRFKGKQFRRDIGLEVTSDVGAAAR